MSEADLEMIRGSIEAFNRGDLDRAIADFDPEVEWYPRIGALDADIYRGHSELTKMWADIRQHLAGFQIEIEEMVDLGDQVVVGIRATGSGGESGANVEDRWAQLITIRGGKIAKVEAFGDKAQAIKAAGA